MLTNFYLILSFESMIYSAHQSSFLPRVGFRKKVNAVDIFDVSIHDQFTPTTRQHFSYIRGACEWKKEKRGLPIQKSSFWLPIKDIKVAPWFAKEMLDKFYTAHSQDIYFEVVFPVLSERLFSVERLTYLWEVNQILFNRMLLFLWIDTRCINALKQEKQPSNDILKNVLSYGCSTYLSGPHWKNYLDEIMFEQNNVKILYLDTSEDFKKYPYSIVSLLSMYGVPFVLSLLKEKIKVL